MRRPPGRLLGPRALGADNYSRSDCVEKAGGWRSAWQCGFLCVDVSNVFGTSVSHHSEVNFPWVG